MRPCNIINGIMRKAVRDVEVKGHLIPKGWCVFVYFRSVHLDGKHYDEPYRFNPWRWKVRLSPTFGRDVHPIATPLGNTSIIGT
jgi:steroid 3-oxidase